MGALAELDKIEAALAAVLGGADPPVWSGEDAAELVEAFSRIERRGAAGKALAAHRVAVSRVWVGAGDRSAAHWLARRAGSTVGAAAAVMETAVRLEGLPATAEAFRSGQLSEVQAREIASAAAGHPGREDELLAVARSESVQGLRLACRAAVAGDRDETAAHRAVHRSRYLKHWIDDDGAARLSVRLTVEDMATVLAAVDAFEAEVFATARAQGRVEPYHAYQADALVAAARAAVSAGTDRAGGGPKVMVQVLVDHAALLRGRAEPGETCEIVGVGRVPVATARTLMADAFVTALDSDGVDVYRVAHLGRTVTAHQRSALAVRDRECVIEGCHVTRHLEIDHVEEWAATHVTRLDRLARLCHFHHHQKTYDGYQLLGSPGHWQWIPPDPTPAGAADH
jgi:Domain of unknown function (DUF222)